MPKQSSLAGLDDAFRAWDKITEGKLLETPATIQIAQFYRTLSRSQSGKLDALSKAVTVWRYGAGIDSITEKDINIMRVFEPKLFAVYTANQEISPTAGSLMNALRSVRMEWEQQQSQKTKDGKSPGRSGGASR